MGVGTDEDRVDVAREDAGGVFRRLAGADHEFGAGREEGVAAELGHADFE